MSARPQPRPVRPPHIREQLAPHQRVLWDAFWRHLLAEAAERLERNPSPGATDAPGDREDRAARIAAVEGTEAAS